MYFRMLFQSRTHLPSNVLRKHSLDLCAFLKSASREGITAARPPFFILRFGARSLGFIDISDLNRLRCLLEPCFEIFHFSENNCRTKCFGKTLWAYAFNFFIFPKTAAGPSASEKPCGRMLSIFSFFRKRLPDQVLRKSFVGVLGGSWHLWGGF